MYNWQRTVGQWLMYVLSIVALVSCGGGGDSVLPVQGVSSTKIVATASADSFSPSSSVQVTATLSPASAGKVVKFKLNQGNRGTLVNDTATTDASGKASVLLSGAGATEGNGSLTVTYTDPNNDIATTTIPYRINSGETVLLSMSKNTLPTGSSESVTLTAFVTDAGGGAVKNKEVRFDTGGGASNGTLSAGSVATDANGQAQVTFTPPSVDRDNKDITISASIDTSGGKIIDTETLSLTGSRIVLTSPQKSVVIGSQVDVLATVLDGSGKIIVGKSLTFTSDNLATPKVLTSNSSGQASFKMTITKVSGGSEASLSANAVGATQVAPLSWSVSTVRFTFTAPVPNQNTDDDPALDTVLLNIGNTHTIKVQWTDDSIPGTNKGVAGKVIKFDSTLGTLSANEATTDGSGVATVTITSGFAGEALIEAVSKDNANMKSSLKAVFTATVASQISVQAAQTVLAPRAQTEITATVRDANNNPVAFKTVSFAKLADDSAGSLGAATATTDAAGVARVTFTAGPSSGATNGVQIQGKVIENGSPITSTVPLTVGGQAVFINISVGATLSEESPTLYAKPFSVIVTDASGAPVAGQEVILKVKPTYYFKGHYIGSQQTKWQPVNGDFNDSGNPLPNPTAFPADPCPAEDLDDDGILDTGEDRNYNGILDPGGPATLTASKVTTNTSGYAAFSVIYGRSYANWVQIRVTATTKVGGTESKADHDLRLPILDSDAAVEHSPPGGTDGPWGGNYWGNYSFGANATAASDGTKADAAGKLKQGDTRKCTNML